MEYKLSEQELQDLMHRTWLEAKRFYNGKTDRYFFEYFESEKEQLPIYNVVGQSEQLVCNCQACGEVKKVEYCEKCYAENLTDIAN